MATALRILRVLPNLDAKYLEAVLDALPEPSSVKISMVGKVHQVYDESTKTVGGVLGFPNRLRRSYSSLEIVIVSCFIL